MRRLCTWPILFLVAVQIPAAEIRFEERTIPFVLRNGANGHYHLPELMVGGVGVIDYDGDGCMDIFFANGAAMPSLVKTGPEFSNRLFHNDCQGHFEDVTEKAGVAGEGFSIAVAIGDYDHDGRPDIFVAGVNRNLLYRNNGNGTFTERAVAAGLMPKGGRKPWSISAGFFDMDNDGWPDLFISNYVDWDPNAEPRCGGEQERFYCHPQAFKGETNQLFRNNHDGTFTDISAKAGITAEPGRGMGVAFADFDGDGLTDIFVANDSMRAYLYHNLGSGKFKEVALDYGASLPDDGRAIAGMGVDFRDYDNDGRPDILMTGMVNDSFLLFHNAGPPVYFEDRTASSGLAVLTRSLTGWSMGLVDLDNDGWKDLFAANAHFSQYNRLLGVDAPLPNAVFRNLGNGRFGAVNADLGAPSYNRGTAFADFNGDGLVDVVVTRIGEPARLYMNVTQNAGKALLFHEPLGAQMEVDLPNGMRLFNHATSSVGYASSSDPAIRFGLGGYDQPARVLIRLPGQAWKPLR